MKNLTFLILLTISAMIASCSEEDDCVGCNLNPGVKVKFETAQLRAEISGNLTETGKLITVLRDSLQKDLTAEQRSLVQNALVNARGDSAKFANQSAQLRSGRFLISELEASGAVGMEYFQDTLVMNFALPVNMNSDTTTFFIAYYENMDTLQITYTRSIFQNLTGVRMRLSNIEINEIVTTFDSLRVQCSRGVCNNEATTIFIFL